MWPSSDEVMEAVKALTKSLGKLHAESLEEVRQGLNFVDATMNGLKVFVLVDTSATHSVVRKQNVTSLHSTVEGSQGTFKGVNG